MRAEELMPSGWLTETPIARPGEWNFDASNLGILSRFFYDKDWSVMDRLQVGGRDLEIIRHKNANQWRVGNIETRVLPKTGETHTAFHSVFFILLRNVKNVAHRLHYHRLYQVETVGVHEDARGVGIAKTMYRYLVKTHGYLLIGDREQYFGARRLWASLSRDTDISVDLVDLANDAVIGTEVVLHQGRYDADFDQAVWSYGREREHIRMVLRDVI